MAETPGPGRRIVFVLALALLPFLCVLRVGWYFRDRSILEGEILGSIQAEWAALKAEEAALPPGTNAAEVWKGIGGLLHKESWAALVAEEKGQGGNAVEMEAPALALVDEALKRPRALFSVQGGMTQWGPQLEAPYGPEEQSEAYCRVPRLLVVRGRRSLGDGKPREALEDARRALLCIRQGQERCFIGPLLATFSINGTDDLVRDALRSPALALDDARYAAALPKGSEVFVGREAQQRLHRLYGDIELCLLLRKSFVGKKASDLREELRLPTVVPLLGFSIRDPAAFRALRGMPVRPLRAGGFEKWPESGPLGCLLRLDLLRTAAALRAFQMEHGRPAPDLAGIDTGYLGQASPVYEVRGEGWTLHTASNRAPGMFHSLYQDPHWSDCAWADAEMDLSFEWPPK